MHFASEIDRAGSSTLRQHDAHASRILRHDLGHDQVRRCACVAGLHQVLDLFHEVLTTKAPPHARIQQLGSLTDVEAIMEFDRKVEQTDVLGVEVVPQSCGELHKCVSTLAVLFTNLLWQCVIIYMLVENGFHATGSYQAQVDLAMNRLCPIHKCSHGIQESRSKMPDFCSPTLQGWELVVASVEHREAHVVELGRGGVCLLCDMRHIY